MTKRPWFWILLAVGAWFAWRKWGNTPAAVKVIEKPDPNKQPFSWLAWQVDGWAAQIDKLTASSQSGSWVGGTKPKK